MSFMLFFRLAFQLFGVKISSFYLERPLNAKTFRDGGRNPFSTFLCENASFAFFGSGVSRGGLTGIYRLTMGGFLRVRKLAPNGNRFTPRKRASALAVYVYAVL